MKRFLWSAMMLAISATGVVAQDSSLASLERRAIDRRAVEAVIWGMPVVNADLMLQARLASTEAKENEVVYWLRPVNWKTRR